MGFRARSEMEEGFGSQQKMNLGKTIKHSGMCMKRRSEELMLQGRMLRSTMWKGKRAGAHHPGLGEENLERR